MSRKTKQRGPAGISAGQREILNQRTAEIRKRLVEAQRAAAQTEIVGLSADERVEVVVTGNMSLRSVQIDPALQEGDVAILETSVAEAFADAVAKVSALRAGSTGGVDISEIDLGAAPLDA